MPSVQQASHALKNRYSIEGLASGEMVRIVHVIILLSVRWSDQDVEMIPGEVWSVVCRWMIVGFVDVY